MHNHLYRLCGILIAICIFASPLSASHRKPLITKTSLAAASKAPAAAAVLTKSTSYMKYGAIIGGVVLLLSVTGTMANDLGIKEGQLSPCPESPNCVSSQASNPSQKVEPFSYTGPFDGARADLKSILDKNKRVHWIKEEPRYFHVEFRSKWLGFVDDVEFYFPENEALIHVRSASRVGYSDFGVNQKRIEHLRKTFKSENQRFP